MIKIIRGVVPKHLHESRDKFNEEVISLSSFSSSNIKKLIKKLVEDKQIHSYSINYVKDALLKMSDSCVFCGRIFNDVHEFSIEHIKCPWNIYYKYIFEWSNLLPACKGCNNSRSRVKNPYDPNLYLDPTVTSNIEDLFGYEFDGRIIPNKSISNHNLEAKVNEMIRLYKLNRAELIDERFSFIEVRKHKNAYLLEELYNDIGVTDNTTNFMHLLMYIKGGGFE